MHSPIASVTQRVKCAGLERLIARGISQPRLPCIPVTRRRHRGRSRRFPDPDLVVVASRREDSGVRGVPRDAVYAADVCVKSFDEEAVGAPDVYSRVWECVC